MEVTSWWSYSRVHTIWVSRASQARRVVNEVFNMNVKEGENMEFVEEWGKIN